MKIVFMGTPEAAVPSLARILSDGHRVIAVYTQPDRPAGRGHRLHTSPVKDFAVSRDLPVYQPAKLRITETIEAFEAHEADVAIVVAYGRILTADYLNAFSRGAVNVHFSLLPKYRGAAPVNWAIAEGEADTGVTTMQMDQGLDTGDILLQTETRIGQDENAIDLMSRLADIGAQLLSDTLTGLNTIQPRKQDDDQASLAPILKKDDGRFDWTMDAEKIARRVRGFQPFPGTFTQFRGKNLKIWRASSTADNGVVGKPGEILEIMPDRISAICGKGILQLLEVQPEGKKRVPVRDFINGSRPEKGELFGE